MNKELMKQLVEYCGEHADVYCEVANKLHDTFEITSAEMVLIITYFIVRERNNV